jgi:hypothetical protein
MYHSLTTIVQYLQEYQDRSKVIIISCSGRFSLSASTTSYLITRYNPERKDPMFSNGKALPRAPKHAPLSNRLQGTPNPAEEK